MAKWDKPADAAAEVVEEAAPVAEVAAEPIAEPAVEEVAPVVEPAVVEKVEKTVLGKALKSAKDELKGEERVRVRWTGGSSLGVADGTFIRFVDGVATIKAKHFDELKKYGVEKF